MTKSLNVKENNVVTYVLDMLYNKPDNSHRSCGVEINPYYIFKNELFFKKDRGIETGDTIEFELEEITNQSRSVLANKYTYRAEDFDSVSIKMTLIDFKVEFKSRLEN